ncbi:MAG: DUF3226 domain-containing protein [Solibacillus sp.]
MKSAIICEGSTDLVLIQYFLEKTYGWTYTKDQNTFKVNSAKSYIWLNNNEDYLCIINSGGVSKLLDQLDWLLLFNKNLFDDASRFDKIVLVSDHDEPDTITNFVDNISSIFRKYSITSTNELENDEWFNGTYFPLQQEKRIDFLMLIIPFEGNGAIENFLLNALKDDSSLNDPDKVIFSIVEQCEEFIDNLDVKDKFLKKRREKLKAKFSTVFVVLTPAEAFTQRKTLLQSANWEDYLAIQSAFSKFLDLKSRDYVVT